MGKAWCDGCHRERKDVQSVGRDANGDPDAPDLCFVCRKEAARGRHYSFILKKYIWNFEFEPIFDGGSP